MRYLAIGIMVTLFTLTGCDKLKEFAGEAKKAMEQTAQQAEAPDPEMIAKNAVTEAYNELIGSVPSIVRSYDKKYPLVADFKAPERDSFNNPIHTLVIMEHAIRDARKALTEADKVTPDNFKELVGHAKAMLGAAEKVEKVLKDIDKYFKAEDFKDDKYARMTELHKSLREAVTQFGNAADTLGTNLSMEEDARDMAELKEHEAAKSYSYWFRYLLIHAKALQKVTNGDNVAKEVLLKACDEFTTHYDAFKAWTDAQTSLYDPFTSYVSSAERFNITKKKMCRGLKEDPVDINTVNRHMQTLVSNYNSLVSSRNMLSQHEAKGLLK
jgi:hypothetical protein